MFQGEREVPLVGHAAEQADEEVAKRNWLLIRRDNSCERSIDAPQRVQLITLTKPCQAFLESLSRLITIDHCAWRGVPQWDTGANSFANF